LPTPIIGFSSNQARAVDALQWRRALLVFATFAKIAEADSVDASFADAFPMCFTLLAVFHGTIIKARSVAFCAVQSFFAQNVVILVASKAVSFVNNGAYFFFGCSDALEVLPTVGVNLTRLPKDTLTPNFWQAIQ
jgi:hypothetical protein